MTQPFIPFPIFPPYSHWYPGRKDELPANLEVAARLRDVDPECQPFTSLWYANHYINWIAHSWSYETPHLQYYNCIHALEKMLNWSFSNRRSLLDWTREDFEQYANFIINPSGTLVSSSVQHRFLALPDQDYKDWPINPGWRLFQGRRHSDTPSDQNSVSSMVEQGAGSSKEDIVPRTLPPLTQKIDQNVWKREIRRVKQFLDFYLTDAKATRPNVADAKLDFLEFKEPQPLAVLSDIELEWIFQELPNLLGVHEQQLFEMYLTIGRYTNQPMRSVIGTTASPGRLDQFSRRNDGRWLAYHAGKKVFAVLSPQFDKTFERYLHYLNIDEKLPLPSTALFPSKDHVSAYDRKKFWTITQKIREDLADLARASNDPVISDVASKIRELSLKVVSNRPAEFR